MLPLRTIYLHAKQRKGPKVYIYRRKRMMMRRMGRGKTTKKRMRGRRKRKKHESGTMKRRSGIPALLLDNRHAWISSKCTSRAYESEIVNKERLTILLQRSERHDEPLFREHKYFIKETSVIAWRNSLKPAHDLRGNYSSRDHREAAHRTFDAVYAFMCLFVGFLVKWLLSSEFSG